MKALTRFSFIPRTSAATAALGASRFMSWITASPPGRSTRCISSRALTGCLKFLNAAWQTIRSKTSFSKGMAVTSPWRKSTDTPAARALSVAISTMVRLMSSPVTRSVPGRAISMAW